jgi:hypothetical protein
VTEHGIVKVKAHTRSFDRVEDPSEWGKKFYEKWGKSAPAEVLEALTDYKVTGYRWINGILRGTAEEQRREWNEGEGYEDVTKQDLQRMYDQWVPHIDRAFKTAPVVPENITVYRGTIAQTYEVGDEFTDPGFASTSLTISRAQDFAAWQTERSEWPEEDGPKQPPGVVAEIRVPKGTRAIYLDAVTKGVDEFELLLDRGLKYRVVSADPLVLEVVS